MYKGKKTLFYNGEKLHEGAYHDGETLIHDWEERRTWEVVMVLPGVEIIPEFTFSDCDKIKTVIMADTVKRIEEGAFLHANFLHFVKLSANLEYIGRDAFVCCFELTSIFIPQSCLEISHNAFRGCEKLIILHVPQHTRLGAKVIAETALIRESPIANTWTYEYEDQPEYQNITNEVNEWLKNIHNSDDFALHRACSSFNPLEDIIYEIVKRQGISSFKKPNSIGITPSQYLQENPYAEIEERKIVNRYVLDMMGENVM
ncbi:hypothetical protein CTEN210_00843 [Chaetoceros tenuissimus]|uniref:Leucine-rich repeat domain-containing protein n=1 Tax=Chaetoceros tenuissimus TaxID=426638 RepID=A0AAD3CGB4_9STRA|nr:hypothetical protein CTEN210_00843 [Chaetoceros tenuissimus]